MAPLLYPSAGSGLANTANNEHAAHIVDQDLKVKACHVPHECEGFLQRGARIYCHILTVTTAMVGSTTVVREYSVECHETYNSTGTGSSSMPLRA